MKSIFKNSIIIAALLFGAASVSNAQVKIGASPATIGANSNLEVEAANGNKTIVNKATGQVTIQDGTQAAGRVLTSDAAGLASWQVSPTQTSQSVVSAYSQVIQGVAPGSHLLSFTSETVDRNNDFDSANGIFTAPSTGQYWVNCYVRVSAQAPYETGRIVFEAIAEVINGNSSPLFGGEALQGSWGYGSGSRLVTLNQGQQVRIRFNVGAGGASGQNRILDQKIVEFVKLSN